VFDMFINFYLCYVLLAFKSNEQNLIDLMGGQINDQIVWKKDALIPSIFSSLSQRMPACSKYTVNTVITALCEVVKGSSKGE